MTGDDVIGDGTVVVAGVFVVVAVAVAVVV